MENSYSINDINKTDDLAEIKNNKTSLITFAKLNKYFLIPFLCPIFCKLANFFVINLMEAKKTKKLDFFTTIYLDLSYVSAGIIHYISYFKNNINKVKGNENRDQSSNTGITYIYTYASPDNLNSKRIMILILLLGLMLCLKDLIDMLIFDKNVFEMRFYFLLFIPIFSKIILKENIYKYQYFSLLIALSGIIFLFIPVCFKL